MAIWTNSDGLEVRFGLDRTTEQPSGRTAAEEKTLVWTLNDATTLGDTDTAAVAGDEAFIPGFFYLGLQIRFHIGVFLEIGLDETFGFGDGDSRFPGQTLGPHAVNYAEVDGLGAVS